MLSFGICYLLGPHSASERETLRLSLPTIPEPSGKCLALRGWRTCIWPQASLSKLQASSFIKRFLYISYGNIHVKRLCFYTIAKI